MENLNFTISGLVWTPMYSISFLFFFLLWRPPVVVNKKQKTAMHAAEPKVENAIFELHCKTSSYTSPHGDQSPSQTKHVAVMQTHFWQSWVNLSFQLQETHVHVQFVFQTWLSDTLVGGKYENCPVSHHACTSCHLTLHFTFFVNQHKQM